MISKQWLLLLLFLLTGVLQAQDFKVVRSVDWKIPGTFSFQDADKNKATVKYLNFEGARFTKAHHYLPSYSELIPIDQKRSAQASIHVLSSSPLKKDQLLTKEQEALLSEKIHLKQKIVEARSKRFLQLSFVPIFFNNGQLQQVERFEVHLHNADSKMTESHPLQKSVENSVLSEGKWLKIRVPEDGVYKITYENLKAHGFTQFQNIAIYGNAESVLPQDNALFEDKDPVLNAVRYVVGEDGEFNAGDYILFYGKSPNQAIYNERNDVFDMVMHPYSSANYYFITENSPSIQAIDYINEPDTIAQRTATSFPDYIHHEENLINLIESGREWFGEPFGVRHTYNFDFSFPHRIVEQPVKISARVVSRASATSKFSFSINNEAALELPVESVNYNFTSYYARDNSGLDSVLAPGSKLDVKAEFIPPNSSANGWLDFITLNATRQLRMEGDQLHFHYISNEPHQVARFEIDNVSDNITVWDITNPTEPKEIKEMSVSNGKASFKILPDTLVNHFVAFTGEQFLKPEIVGTIENQNLHGLPASEMIIVTKERFLTQAYELARLHEDHDGLKSVVVTDKQIFNEFSSGNPDPSAIRNFVRHMHNKSNPSDSLYYLLFFGDGSYDNRECHQTEYLLTYQSKESLHYSNSFVSDDFFGMIDETDDIEAGHLSGLVDVGIGRLPVTTIGEAENAVEKIRTYLEYEPDANWLNEIVFVADDEDNNDHVEDAEQLSNFVNNQYKEFDISKIYLDAFEQKTNATGAVYPEVNKAINEKINNGILLLNYSGHGGEHHLAHERILTKEDIASWKNGNRLPVFMTGTCEFTRFDDPSLTSAGEEIFLREKGGAIALFSTTRLVYANQNYALNRAFYNYVFRRSENEKPFRLGDIVRLTKNYAGTDDNKRNFSLFGDPALKLPVGKYQVITDSILSNDQTTVDTLRGLDRITVYGHIEDEDGFPASSFNGPLFVEVKDRVQPFYTKANDGGSTFSYMLRANTLFKGEAHIEQGTFRIEFIVPGNLGTDFGNGKIIYWGHQGNTIAQGSYDKFVIGGMSDKLMNDENGPEIELFMNDRNFKDGGVTHDYPRLVADFQDESGINVSGLGVGHDIIAILDQDYSNPIVLNDYYQAENGSFTEGTLQYQFNNLASGEHTLKLEAWDVNNNFSSASIQFHVEESNEFSLVRVFNAPNPFHENTAFYFEHNRPDEPMDVSFEIFDLTGRKVKTYHKKIEPGGFMVGPVYLEGLGEIKNKFGSGIYLYRVNIRLNEGEIASKTEKFILIK